MAEQKLEIHFVNIGSCIRQKLHQIGMSKAELSRALGMNQSNLNKLLNKYSIESSKLIEISKVMKYNFFKDFFMDSDYIDVLLGDEEFYISEVNIGYIIDKRIKELGLKQKEVADKISEVQSFMIEELSSLVNEKNNLEHTFRQQYISTISKRSSVDTLMLCYLSYALKYNFFECFYKKDTVQEKNDSKQQVSWEAYKKEQFLLIEIGELKHTINVLRRILKAVSVTDENLKKLGITDEEIRTADINADEYELVPKTPLSIHV